MEAHASNIQSTSFAGAAVLMFTRVVNRKGQAAVRNCVQAVLHIHVGRRLVNNKHCRIPSHIQGAGHHLWLASPWSRLKLQELLVHGLIHFHDGCHVSCAGKDIILMTVMTQTVYAMLGQGDTIE